MDWSKLGKSFHSGSSKTWGVELIRTGLGPFDYALGGGIGRGRIVEIYGTWSSGKTALLYCTLATNQRNGGVSVLLESEGAYHPNFFSAMHGDPDSLMVSTADTVEELFDLVHKILKEYRRSQSSSQLVIGWDSVASTATRHLSEAGMDRRDMSKAEAMSRGLQLILMDLKECGACFVVTNQIREVIGDMSYATHTPGGKALPFAASQRVELRFDGGEKGSRILIEEQEVGRWIRGEVTKNKLAAPFGRFVFPIYSKGGFRNPEFGWVTEIGIDHAEALFYFYLRSGIRINDEPIIHHTQGGWYALSQHIGDRPKFQKRHWREVLEQYPSLWTLMYTL